MMTFPPLRPFDLPAVGTGRPDPDLLLVGAPEARIGRVRAAWSNVRVHPPRRRLFTAPAIGFGVMAALLGTIVGFFALGSSGPTDSAFAAALFFGLPLAAGSAGFFLGGRLASGEASEKATYFIGEQGFQKNVLKKDAVATSTALLGDHWLLYDRTHRTLERGGNAYDLGVFTRVELVPKTPGYDSAPILVPPSISEAVCDAAVQIRLAESRTVREWAFPIFDIPIERGSYRRAQQRGHIIVTPECVVLSSGGRTERVPLGAVVAYIRAGFLAFDWQSDRADVPLREIGDSPFLIELLHRMKVLQERTA